MQTQFNKCDSVTQGVASLLSVPKIRIQIDLEQYNANVHFHPDVNYNFDLEFNLLFIFF